MVSFLFLDRHKLVKGLFDLCDVKILTINGFIDLAENVRAILQRLITKHAFVLLADACALLKSPCCTIMNNCPNLLPIYRRLRPITCPRMSPFQ